MLKEIINFIVYKPEFSKKIGGDFCEGVEVAPQPGEKKELETLTDTKLEAPQTLENRAILG